MGQRDSMTVIRILSYNIPSALQYIICFQDTWACLIYQFQKRFHHGCTCAQSCWFLNTDQAQHSGTQHEVTYTCQFFSNLKIQLLFKLCLFLWLSLALSALVSKCWCFLLWWNPGLLVFPGVEFLFLHTLNLFQNSNLMTEKPFKVLCCWPSSCTTSVTIFSSWTLHEGTACYCCASQTSAFIINHLMNFCNSELWNTPTINFALSRLRKSLKMCIFSSLPR